MQTVHRKSRKVLGKRREEIAVAKNDMDGLRRLDVPVPICQKSGMKPPDEFIDEYWKMRERIDWLEASGITGEDIGKAKLFVGELLEFYEKWHPVIKDAELRAGLQAARGGMEDLRIKLEKIYWAHLHEVIEERKEWLFAEAIFKGVVAITVLRRQMPETLKAGFEQILLDHSPGGFDAEKEYRETEKNVADAEAKFRKALAGLEVDWPERVDAALRGRLEKTDMTGANAWQAEVVAQQEAVK
jgi:hypothetical protein